MKIDNFKRTSDIHIFQNRLHIELADGWNCKNKFKLRHFINNVDKIDPLLTIEITLMNAIYAQESWTAMRTTGSWHKPAPARRVSWT